MFARAPSLSVVAAVFLLVGCQRHQLDVAFSPRTDITVRSVPQADLAYLLTHMDIYAESPKPYLPPSDHTTGVKFRYRILGVTKQGNCVPMCPPSTVFVVISDYIRYHDGRIQLYRIDGARFVHSVEVEDIKGDEDLLSFTFESMPHPSEKEKYRAKIAFAHAAVERVAQ